MSSVLFFLNSLTGGGAERVGYEMIVALAESHKVKVVTIYNESSDYGSLPNNCESYALGLERDAPLIRKIYCMMGQLPKINSFIGDIGEYCLVTAHLQMSHILAALSKVSSNTLYVMHGAQWPSDPNRTFLRKLTLRFFYGCREIVCVSQGIKKELEQFYGIDPGRCCVIHNPFDINKVVQKSNEPFNVDLLDPYFLCVGRLNAIKRFDRAISIFKEGGFYNTHYLVFLGKGEEYSALKRLAVDLGVQDRIIFAGFSDNPFPWMKNADLLLCTSDSEAFPMGLIEALVCGTRVVAADCDYGPREILTAELTDFLISPIDDIESYVKTIRTALESYPQFSPAHFSKYEMGVILDLYFQKWSDCCARQ